MANRDEEEFENETAEEGTHSRTMPALVLMTAMVAFVGLAWYAYRAGTDSVSDEELLIVEAEDQPMKEAPLDPGGMEFPHQDKSVFEAITSSGSTPTAENAENIVSSSETPVDVPVADVATTATPVGSTSTAAAETAAPAEQATAAAVDSNTETAVEPQTETIAEAKPAETKSAAHTIAKVETSAEAKAAKEKAAAKLVAKNAAELESSAGSTKSVSNTNVSQQAAEEALATAKAVSGSNTVQLGAFRSEAEANAAWNKLSKKHAALSGKTPSIIKADLGSKGVFYRLRVSGVDAVSTCGALKAKGDACMKV